MSDNTSESAADGTQTGPIRTVPRDADPDSFPSAIAARIGDRALWIANGRAIDPDNLETLGLNPMYVVSVNLTPTNATTDHYALKDGFLNDQEVFTRAVDTTRKRLRDDGTVIVNCAAGISRSSAVIATALAAEENMTFDDAVDEIRETREYARPHSKLQLNATVYLAALDRPEAQRRRDELIEKMDGEIAPDRLERILHWDEGVDDRTTEADSQHDDGDGDTPNNASGEVGGAIDGVDDREATPGNGATDTVEGGDTRTIPADGSPGYPFPEAVAVRIGNRDLWIANGDAVIPDNLDELGINPMYVVSLNRRATNATTDHHHLEDAEVNPHDDFTAAVDAARKRISQDGTTIINCAAGVSRSATVMATALAAEQDIPLWEAIELVEESRERATPHTKLQVNAYAYLADVESRQEAIDGFIDACEKVSPNGTDTERMDELTQILDV
jgi:atypical dual specificity phosphatase